MTDEPKPKRRGRTKKEESVRMRPLNVEVPEDLQLHRRGTLCKRTVNTLHHQRADRIEAKTGKRWHLPPFCAIVNLRADDKLGRM